MRLRVQHVPLFQQHVPEFVQIFVRFYSQLLRLPRSTDGFDRIRFPVLAFFGGTVHEIVQAVTITRSGRGEEVLVLLLMLMMMMMRIPHAIINTIVVPMIKTTTRTQTPPNAHPSA